MKRRLEREHNTSKPNCDWKNIPSTDQSSKSNNSKKRMLEKKNFFSNKHQLPKKILNQPQTSFNGNNNTKGWNKGNNRKEIVMKCDYVNYIPLKSKKNYSTPPPPMPVDVPNHVRNHVLKVKEIVPEENITVDVPVAEITTAGVKSPLTFSNEPLIEFKLENVDVDLQPKKFNLTTFVESLVEEAKDNETGRQALRNILWTLLKDKCQEFLGETRLADMEKRLATLEFITARKPCSDNVNSSTGDCESFSYDGIQILEEFSTEFCANKLPKFLKTERVQEIEPVRKRKRKISTHDVSGSIPISLKNIKREPESSEGTECVNGNTETENSDDLREEKPTVLTDGNLIRFAYDCHEFVKVYTCGIRSEDRSRSGLGVWFSDAHPLNVSFPISTVSSEKLLGMQAVWIAVKMAKKAECIVYEEFLSRWHFGPGNIFGMGQEKFSNMRFVPFSPLPQSAQIGESQSVLKARVRDQEKQYEKTES